MAKKIKKVETPIDQRETFVSIQKNFADSDLSVEEKLRTLYDLQQADSEIDKILQLRGELPSEVAALEEEIKVLNAKAASITAEIEGFNESISLNKENIIDCDTQIAKYTEQLNNISNSREYDSINKEIENQELLRKIAEKRIGETKAEILTRKADLEDVKDLIEVRSEDLKIKQEELDNIVESTAKEENALRAKRNKCASIIDPRTMSAYERIRESEHNHLAVVTVYNGNACGGCFNMIIPQRLIEISSNKKLIICEHCGRIIVNPDFSNKE